MENYEKKYKKALEIARKINSGEGVAAPPDWTSYEVIFPELKESKDDRIVRCLLNYFNHVRYNGLDLKGTDIDEVIAWLEKQGEKATHINGEDCGIDGLYHAIKILERTVGRVTGYQSDDGILSHEAAIDAVKELYKKQGGQEHFYDFNANDWYVSKVDGKIHNMNYNPTDKVEPKFKVGDFIANDYCSGKVIKITNDGYLLDTGQGIPFSCEHNAHLWTIQDAKEGNVLIKEETEEPFIYNGNHGAYLPEFVGGYCGIRNGEFTPNGSTCYWGRPTCPATKEQRDQLFQKMEKAGYEWDSEKKELKEIEPKNSIVNVPPREVILSIWDLGNEWKELTNGCISTEYGTQLDYIQKHWHESEYYLKETQK